MKQSRDYHCRGIASSRRDFLRVGSLGFLGIGLSDYLRLSSIPAFAAPGVAGNGGRAQACILLWLEGGISQVDSWDPKGNTGFEPISTKVPGIQISELLPQVAGHMDKLSIIRSMKTKETNHPQGTIETLTGHRPNPVTKFPSFGSIVSKELGPRRDLPPYVVVPTPTEFDFFSYEEAYKASFIGGGYDAMILPDPSKP